MLHNSAPIQLHEVLDQLSGGSCPLFEKVKYFAPSRVAECSEDRIVLVLRCQATLSRETVVKVDVTVDILANKVL